MSISERNLFIEILHKNGTKREYIPQIIKDLESINLFDDDYDYEDDPEWDFLEKEASIIFSRTDKKKRLVELKKIRQEKDAYFEDQSLQNLRKTSFYMMNSDTRIRLKRQELIKLNILQPDKDDELEVAEASHSVENRYGRSPLHEAIAMRDIRLVKKYVMQNLFLDVKDNNGHTPKEMAYYEGYSKALKIFESISNSKNKFKKKRKYKKKRK